MRLYNLRQEYSGARAIAKEMLDAQQGQARAADDEVSLEGRALATFLGCEANLSFDSCVEPLRHLHNEAQQRFGPDSALALDILNELGTSMTNSGHLDDAVTVIREAYESARRANGVEHIKTLLQAADLGYALSLAGKGSEGIPLLQQAREQLLKLAGSEDPITVSVDWRLGDAYYFAGTYEKALEFNQRAYQFRAARFGSDDHYTQVYEADYVLDLMKLERFQEALPLQREVVDAYKRQLGQDHTVTLSAQIMLAGIYGGLKDDPAAEQTFNEALRRGRVHFKNGEWILGNFEFRYADFLAKRGRNAEAETLLREAIAIYTKAMGPDGAYTKRAKQALEKLTGAK